MVKVTFTNNAGSKEKIVNEGATVREIMNDAEFIYAGASVVVNGVTIDEAWMDEPLANFINDGATSARISAIPHKANA